MDARSSRAGLDLVEIDTKFVDLISQLWDEMEYVGVARDTIIA